MMPKEYLVPENSGGGGGGLIIQQGDGNNVTGHQKLWACQKEVAKEVARGDGDPLGSLQQ